MQNGTVWIVHETLHMLMLVRNAVRMRGYRTVRCFTGGDEVIALLKKGEQPDVIIADDRLAGTSGNDLLTMVDSLCETCRGILLVPPDANPYASRHLCVIEGAAGFHDSLLEALGQTEPTRPSEPVSMGGSHDIRERRDYQSAGPPG